MNNKVFLILLATIVLLPGAVAAAQAKQNNQNHNGQQQASQQHDSNNPHHNPQGSNNQDHASSDKNATSSHGEKASSEADEQDNLVGRADQKNLIAAQKPNQVLSSTLIGMTVRNKAKSFGTIQNLILDKDYQVVGFVVDMSGITGLIQKSIGVAWSAVQHVDFEKGVIRVNVKNDELQDMRTFTTQQELQEEGKSQDWIDSR